MKDKRYKKKSDDVKLKEILIRLYVNEMKTLEEIAVHPETRIYKLTRGTAAYYLHLFGIKLRAQGYKQFRDRILSNP